MSTLKLEAFGPFSKTISDINHVIDFREIDMQVK